jgi:nucleoside phosphorylase
MTSRPELISKCRDLILEGRRLAASASVGRAATLPGTVDPANFERWRTKAFLALSDLGEPARVLAQRFDTQVTGSTIDYIRVGIAILESAEFISSSLTSDDSVSPDLRCDVMLICALHDPELRKVRQTGELPWVALPTDPSDPQTYYSTQYRTNGPNVLRVISAAPNHMGLSASAVLAAKSILKYRPRFLGMVGIAAGVRKQSQGFGDILIAEHTFDYGAGKISQHGDRTEFRPNPYPMRINSRLLNRLNEWKTQRTGLDEIQGSWQTTSPQTRLQIHIGPLGSGAAVLDSTIPIEEISNHWRKLVGIEMEAHGVHCACNETLEPPPVFCCFKSICDFASSKNDDWQDYAAFAASQFCYKFLTTEWHQLFPND